MSLGEKSWLKLMRPAVAVEQSGTLPDKLTVSPVQKISDSGMIPVSTICVAVLAVTVPVSPAPPVVSVEANVDMRTKNASLVVVGLVMVFSWYVAVTFEPIAAAVRVRYGTPFVVLTIEKPVTPVSALRVADVVTKPVGVVQVPLAVVQYSNSIDPTVLLPGNVNWKKWLTTPPGCEPPSVAPGCSVKLRSLICAAYATSVRNTVMPKLVTNTASIKNGAIRLPFTLMRKF